MIFTSRLLLGLALVWMLVAGCARQDNPTPQAQVYRFQDNPQVMSIYKVGATDTLVEKHTYYYHPNGKVDYKRTETFVTNAGVTNQYTWLMKYSYTSSWNVSSEDQYLTQLGAEVLMQRLSFNYNTSGKIIRRRLETFMFAKSFKTHNYTYNPDGSYTCEIKDSSNSGLRTSTIKVIPDANGNDSLCQVLNTRSNPAVWENGYLFNYDQTRRLSGFYTASTPAVNYLGFLDYQPCKIPSALYDYQFLPPGLDGNPTTYFSFRHAYPFTDPNHIAGTISQYSAILLQKIDDSSGSGVELNPAGYLKTLRYINSTDYQTGTPRPVKYKVVLDY